MLQTSYSTTPYVFLSAEHSVKGIKHDAATVWVENVNTKGFQACLRELQNFDGLHENITVVSWTVHWSRDVLIATKLPSNSSVAKTLQIFSSLTITTTFIYFTKYEMLARKVEEKLIEAVGFKTSTVTWPLMQM